MKLRKVTVNNRKGQIELTVYSGVVYPMPYSKLDPQPVTGDRIVEAYVDKELGNEAVTYRLASGAEGAVHIDHALEYNQDPAHIAEILVHKLTVEARKRVKHAGLSRRELARRMKTSVPQLYRLLDPKNTKKSINQLVELLLVLDCDVDLVVKKSRAA